MAIKVNNINVIDDTRQFIPVTISAGSTTGTSGQVLQSTGVGVTWAAAGGSGTFDTGITTSIYVSVTSGIATGIGTTAAQITASQIFRNNDIFIGPGIAYSFPSTAGYEYIIESMHVTNKSGANLYLSGRHDFNGGQNTPICNKVLIPYQGALELLEQPRVANPSDIIRLQALTGLGTDASGMDGGLDAFITISRKTDTTYVGIGTTVRTTDQEIFTSVTYSSVIQSINLANYNNNVDVDVTVSVFRGGTVGGISTTGVRLGYLAYNLTIPKNSVVEICQKPKQLSVGDSILVTTTPANSVGIVLAGKYIV
jgi:hypothetical protein